MHPSVVSIIVGLIFVIIAILTDIVMIGILGYSSHSLSITSQYILTFMTVFLFTMTIEYTGMNDLACSGNH